MTPKERLLTALRRGETDYVPCAPTFWQPPPVAEYSWNDLPGRLDVFINKLGLDTCLDIGVGAASHPDVTSRAWVEERPGERYPLVHKEIETPAGKLTCTVKKTDDYPHGDDIPLVSDFVVSRIVKPWLQTMDDVEKYAYVCMPPTDETISRRKKSMKPLRKLADEWQVPVRATCGLGLTASLSLFGAQNAVMLSVDQPEVIDRFAEIEHRTTMKRIEAAIELGVDIIARNGFYETADFWSPAQIERFLVPRLQEEFKLCHQGGKPVTYTVCTGIMPIIPQLSKLDCDCLIHIEPVLGDQDMTVIARELGTKKCIWAGLSAPVHIQRGTPDEVRQAVRDAIETFGRRGFILSAVPSIRPQSPWRNVMAMIDEWKKLR